MLVYCVDRYQRCTLYQGSLAIDLSTALPGTYGYSASWTERKSWIFDPFKPAFLRFNDISSSQEIGVFECADFRWFRFVFVFFFNCSHLFFAQYRLSWLEANPLTFNTTPNLANFLPVCPRLALYSSCNAANIIPEQLFWPAMTHWIRNPTTHAIHEYPPSIRPFLWVNWSYDFVILHFTEVAFVLPCNDFRLFPFGVDG